MNSKSKCSGVVLIVDDSPETISMLNASLSEVGLTVLVALSGAQALTIAKRIKPEIILMDGMMPEMDGFEACRLIKADALIAHIPVIFMTGLNASEDIVRGFDAGGIDYITKPIDMQGLIARIGAQLTNSRIANGARQALDSLGQHSLSVDLRGKILWSTPNTHRLMDSSGATQEWIAKTLPASLRPWLAEGAKQPLRLDNLNQPLLVTALQAQDSDERLLAIELANKPNEEDLLKEKFGLTAREAEVLTWITKGKTNHEIAIILDFSPRTANKHLEQIFRKLNVENRTTAAAISLRYLSQIK
ncbi:MAG: response regulator transcription factor [Porticoccaceae bacterium]|nr:response regulator transcription factor [Porticoccaceae bacterium]